ncbi:DUF7344 domain-containing protein [Halomicrococcus sp. NG-SE-24]|uniref:DUF7344 domain-containing protein n=1 Tax=Halomicrococcus sp. NG-SE-24 TaxID=3436928 RepID=UPI003D95C2C7
MAGSHHPPDDNDPEHVRTTHTTHSELDTIFRAVSHPTRRHTLRVLDRTEDPKTVDELASTLAAEPIPSASTDSGQLVTSLTHCHLPHLADVELIDRTSDDHVTATPATTDVVHLLDTALVTFD